MSNLAVLVILKDLPAYWQQERDALLLEILNLVSSITRTFERKFS
jgi:hypothetical protein